MALLNRYWTVTEAAAVKAALPPKLQPLVDLLPKLQYTCYDCEQYADHDYYCQIRDRKIERGECLTAGKLIPTDKRRGEYPCYQPRQLPPF